MNRILNPFEYISNGKAFLWGFAGTVFAILLVTVVRWPLAWDMSMIIRLLSTNLLLWVPLSALLYFAALIFSPSRIRAVDIFATNLFALLPSIVIVGISNAITGYLSHFTFDLRSFGEIMMHAVFYLTVIVLSVSMVWSMVWGCFAYSISANIKGIRSVTIFVVCFVFVSVVIQLMTEYF